MDRHEREEQQPRTEQDQEDQEREVRRPDGIRAEGHLRDDDRERSEVVEGGPQREGSERAQPEQRIFEGGSETERLSSDSMNAPDGRDVVPDHLRIYEREEEQVQAEDQELKESEAGRHRFEEQEGEEQAECRSEPNHGQPRV